MWLETNAPWRDRRIAVKISACDGSVEVAPRCHSSMHQSLPSLQCYDKKRKIDHENCKIISNSLTLSVYTPRQSVVWKDGKKVFTSIFHHPYGKIPSSHLLQKHVFYLIWYQLFTRFSQKISALFWAIKKKYVTMSYFMTIKWIFRNSIAYKIHMESTFKNLAERFSASWFLSPLETNMPNLTIFSKALRSILYKLLKKYYI